MDAKTVIWAAEPAGSQTAALHHLRLELNRSPADSQTPAVLLPLAPLHIPLAIQDVDSLPEGFGLYAGPGPQLRAAALPRLRCSGLHISGNAAYAALDLADGTDPAAVTDPTAVAPPPTVGNPILELQQLIQRGMPGARFPDTSAGDPGSHLLYPDSGLLYLGSWSRQPDSTRVATLRSRGRELCDRLPVLGGMQLTAALVYTLDADAVVSGSDTTGQSGSAGYRWQRLYAAPLRRYLHSA